VIKQLEFPDYFLAIHDIMNFCKDNNILCQDRGSAANSAVRYTHGITAVDRVRWNLRRTVAKPMVSPFVRIHSDDHGHPVLLVSTRISARRAPLLRAGQTPFQPLLARYSARRMP
jgi:hypothetical protein